MRKYFKKILLLLSDYKKELIAVIILLIVSAGMGFLLPIISKNIIDKGLIGQNLSVLAFYCGISVAVSIVTNVCSVIQEKKRLKICNGIVCKLEREAFDHLLKIKMSFYQNENVSTIYSTINTDIMVISSVANPSTFEILTGLFSAMGGAAALCVINVKLLAAVLIMLPLNFLVTFFMSRQNYKLVTESNDKRKIYNSWFSDTIQGVRDIRIFGIQNSRKKIQREKQQELYDLEVRKSMMMVKNNSLIMILLEVISALLYLTAGFLLIKNELSIGEVMAFQSYALMITNPIINALKLFFSISALKPSLKRYYDFIEYPEEESEGEKCIVKGDIVFSDVDFSYSDTDVLLKNLNFSIKQGEKVAVLGKNGVGKTTILNLILRMISPDKGHITYSGKDISNYDIIEYRKQFGVVSQDIFLFNTDIKENICLDMNVDDIDFSNIIKLVALEDLVNERGNDYIVGENGSMLSGGQKQKIAIARALLTKRPVVILDEATSNLDTETVDLLCGLFKDTMKDTTVICVTHTDSVAKIFEKKIII